MLKIYPIFEVFVKQFSFEFEMSWKLKNHESRKKSQIVLWKWPKFNLSGLQLQKNT